MQDTLTDRFHQLIHTPASGPPSPPPGPYSGKKTYTVVGAGSADWNGEYKLEPGAGRLRQTTNASHELYAEGGEWRLAVMGKALAYVASGSGLGSRGPPLSGWTVPKHQGGKPPGFYPGVAPAPHLVGGPDGL